MAGFAAVISLTNTIEHVLQSSRISLPPPSTQILNLAKHELESFQEILERLDKAEASKSRKKVNALDGRIKEAVWEFEDLLESHLYNNILASQFSMDLQCLQHDADSFIETLKGMQKQYIHELHNMPPVEADELVSSEFDSSGAKSEMVGLSDEYEIMRSYFMDGEPTSVELFGMPGIGKTTLARKLFQDPEVSRCFEHRVWVKAGRNYKISEIAGAILSQLDPNGDDLKERLKGKRCLIVLDDVWDGNILEYLQTSFPGENDDAHFQILITTRLSHGIYFSVQSKYHVDFKFYFTTSWMRLLNLKESKELLRRRVFGEENFPYNLKEVAETIAENCEGLPLMILRVAHRLSRANSFDPEYWNEVAKRRSSIFMEAYDEISKVLFPTYDCLFPQHVKMLFIHVGAFPHGYEIQVSKLYNIFTAERLPQVKSLICETLDNHGLLNQILVQKSNTQYALNIKTFGIYSWWWHLFNREAYKDKINRVFYSDEVEEGIKGHRRLCLHTNFLFNLKHIYNTVRCDCASSARSLFCFGPYHQYSMPLNLGFKLLRVLDALKVRFYSFPFEILELALLQYLALTCNGKLPISISKLFNLQFLIIHPHTTIKSWGQTSYLPVQIWDMHELRHIEILGGNLPKPNYVVSLEKLSKLLGVSPECCTHEVFKKIPNLRKLGIQIELTPHNDESNPLSCFDHILELEKLESLKCSVMNPEMTLAPAPVSMFPSRLQKLDLSGFGCPWEYMKVIGSLPDLKVLKLRCYAFRGPMWEQETDSFMSLNYLLIEDTDLVQWKPHGSFPMLQILCIKHCYKLEELHWPTHESPYTYAKRIELVDCNPLAVTCAMKLKEKRYWLQVIASFDDKELI